MHIILETIAANGVTISMQLQRGQSEREKI